MNKIVLEHYPASKLPSELRGQIDQSASVRITLEVETSPEDEALQSLIRRTKALRVRERRTTIGEAVSRIRSLRDEWDH